MLPPGLQPFCGNLWNSLPPDIHNCGTDIDLSTFKCHLKKHFFKVAYLLWFVIHVVWNPLFLLTCLLLLFFLILPHKVTLSVLKLPKVKCIISIIIIIIIIVIIIGIIITNKTTWKHCFKYKCRHQNIPKLQLAVSYNLKYCMLCTSIWCRQCLF